MAINETTSSLQAATLSDDVHPHPQSLPVTLARSYLVGGVHTDCSVQLFQDRSVLTCSQLDGRIGNWLLCKAATDIVSNKVDCDVQHLLGASRDDPELTVYAKRVTIALQQENEVSSILLGMSLKKSSRDPAVFHTIVDLLVQLYKEAAASGR